MKNIHKSKIKIKIKIKNKQININHFEQNRNFIYFIVIPKINECFFIGLFLNGVECNNCFLNILRFLGSVSGVRRKITWKLHKVSVSHLSQILPEVVQWWFWQREYKIYLTNHTKSMVLLKISIMIKYKNFGEFPEFLESILGECIKM